MPRRVPPPTFRSLNRGGNIPTGLSGLGEEIMDTQRRFEKSGKRISSREVIGDDDQETRDEKGGYSGDSAKEPSMWYPALFLVHSQQPPHLLLSPGIAETSPKYLPDLSQLR